MTSLAPEPAPDEKPTETRENERSGAGNAENLQLLKGGAESTIQKAMAEESREWRFWQERMFYKLMVGNGVSEHYLDDHTGSRRGLSTSYN